MNEELELKIKRYMFFKHVDELQYQERYSKIETMILEEFQKLNIDNDHSIAFVDDGGLGEVGCKLASYDDERKLFAFLPKNIDLIWEIKSDAVKRLNPGCNSLRSFIRINVLHEYRHYQQCKFAESMGIKSTDMGEAFAGVPHNENLMEIDARNYALGNASDADLLKLVEAYYKLK